MTSESEPVAGPWLRLCALGAAAATLLAVSSGTIGPATAHQALAALALPPLLALLVAARFVHRRLTAPTLVSLFFFGLAALVTQPQAHVALAGIAFAATLVTAALVFRGERAPSGPWRDYVTLTKPRIMSLLLVTGAGGMVVGAQGAPGGLLFLAAMGGLALACGGASALSAKKVRSTPVHGRWHPACRARCDRRPPLRGAGRGRG